MKKLINSPENVVSEALQGFAEAHADLVKVHTSPAFIYRADVLVKNKVAIISGGGSGHEPMHGGFVGKGMLDAACPGAVFTSPTPDQMLAATKAVDGGKGTLHIVKNYTGDVMNFELAADMARADGLQVESVIIDDDVAVKDSTWTAGRRGVGTTVLAEKICGAAAEAGQSLAEIRDLCKKVNGQGRSMGMALTSCTVPHVGKPTFALPEDEMEVGVGIHGEPGRTRMKVKPVDEIVQLLMEPIITDLPYKSGDEVLLFVNGLGGTPQIELYIVYRKAAGNRQKSRAESHAPFCRFLHHQSRNGWDVDYLVEDGCGLDQALGRTGAHSGLEMGSLMTDVAANCLDTATVLRWFQNCAETYRTHKDELTELDAAIGDADHGANMARGFTAVEGKLADLKDKDIGTIFKTVAMTLISTVGGASGPLFGTFFLQAAAGASGKMALTPQEFRLVMVSGLQGLISRGKAVLGDKTMVDALMPAIEALKPVEHDSLSAALARAVEAAQKGADSTLPMVARKGRASYLGERSAGHLDPGAASSVLLLKALQEAIQSPG